MNVFISNANVEQIGSVFLLLSQMDWAEVEKKFFIFFACSFDSTFAEAKRLVLFTFETQLLPSPQLFNPVGPATRTRSAGQSPIRASNSSPAWIGPTPEGVPVKITSPGCSVIERLANEISSATE